MKVAQAAVDVNGENGPLVVVRIENRAVTVYLSLETGSLQSEAAFLGCEELEHD